MTECYTLYTPRDTHNYRKFTGWMTAGMFMFAAATILIDGKFIPNSLGWILTVASALLMANAMRVYILFLRFADELLRKVHLEALAFAFGMGLVAMMSYRLCERLGAPKLDVNDAGLLMLLTWFAGQWIGSRRYAIAEEEK